MNRKNKVTKDNLIFVSVSLLFLSLLALCAVFGYRYLVYAKTTPEVETELYPANKNVNDDVWEAYSNEEFRFSLQVPKLLLKKEARDLDDYKYIIIFGENQYTNADGVAVGVTDRNLREEIKMVKEIYEKDEFANLKEEKDLKVVGESGIRLSYSPKEEKKDLESREIVIFSHGEFTYTINTTPNQMEKVIQSFKIL